MKPSNIETHYEVEQGVVSPRTGQIGWIDYQTYADRKAAISEARKLANKTAYVRVREVKSIFVSPQYERVLREKAAA